MVCLLLLLELPAHALEKNIWDVVTDKMGGIIPQRKQPRRLYILTLVRLLIVNSLQLVVAIISNIFLLLNMARRIRFSAAQPITIVGWYISAICLASLNATAAGPLVIEPQDEYVLSQAFWYGIWAAILYLVVASLMVITVYGAYTGHYAKDFMLTMSQRTLMLQTIMFLLYLLVGALVFSTIEGWPYLDAVYWANVTLFTVGFGDFAATTTLGRALLIPYALVGVISLGLVIGSIRSMVIDGGRHRVNARLVEKKRRKIVKQVVRKGEHRTLSALQDEDYANATPEEKKMAEYRRRWEEFNLMRRILTEASVMRRWLALGVSAGSWLVLWLVGAKVFQEFERPYQNWTYFDGFYFTFVTLTTIGYGDRTPVSNGGKSFFVFWALLALPTMTVLISTAGNTVVKVVRDATLQLGNITILPSDRGFKRDIQRIINKLYSVLLFVKHFRGAPPGFFSNALPVDLGDDDRTTDQEENGEEGWQREQQDAWLGSFHHHYRTSLLNWN